jgi:sulfur-oxidizing protein SoxY
MMRIDTAAFTRRRRLLAAVAGAPLLIAVRPALAAETLASAIAAYTGGALVRPGKVSIEIARLVENGNTVPVTIDVASPMSADDRVESIALFNERNPERDVARFRFGARAGRASVSTHIRLATSQKLAAVARMNDGSFWSATVDVVVTLAACIEGDG